MLVHKHLIIRAEVNNPPKSAEWCSEWLSTLVDNIGMKILAGPYTEYVDIPGNRGLTGVVIIETSHCTIHSWDETDPGLIQMDVYTCGPLDTQIIFDALGVLDPVKIEYKYLDREDQLIEIEIDK